MRARRMWAWRAIGVLSSNILAFAAGGPAAAHLAEVPTHASSGLFPPLVSGDEAVVVTEHHIKTMRGPLAYEARVGRLPIRSEETGEVRGYIFFVAYVVKSSGARRPITFAWNGGPTISSALIHLEGLGPRRRTKSGMVDNAETLLAESDLVFYDPIETAFSRPAKPEFASEFLNMKGDVATTAEFIRAYRARFRALDQPLFIAGESYGVFRAAAVADFLTDRGDKLAGTILVSGDIPNIPMPIAFYDAMHVPARTATAFYHHRLAPDLMKDRDATMREVNQWSTTVYQPALEHLDQLTDAERENIARELARFMGLRPDQVDRKTLVVHLRQYLDYVSDGGKSKTPWIYDTREFVEDVADLGSATVLDPYIRGELGYATDLTYADLEHGYVPTPGPPARSSSAQFYYNQDGFKQEYIDRTNKEMEVTYVARNNPSWIINALRRDKAMRVFVATGRFDAVNMCEGDAAAVATLSADLSNRIFNHCYESGHIVYRDEMARVKLSRDLAIFIQQALASQTTAPSTSTVDAP